MLKKSHLEKVMSNFFKQYFYQPTIVESGLFDFMLSRVIAMFLQLEIVIDGSRNGWVSPECIHFWPMEMRRLGRGLGPSVRVAEKGIQALGDRAFNSKLFFF